MNVPAAGGQPRSSLGRVAATGLGASGAFNPTVARPNHHHHHHHHHHHSRMALGNLTNAVDRPGNRRESSASDLPKFDPFGRTPLISHFDSSASHVFSSSVQVNLETPLTQHLHVADIKSEADSQAIIRIMEHAGEIKKVYASYLHSKGFLVATFYDVRTAGQALESLKSFYSSEFQEGVQVTYISDVRLAQIFNIQQHDSRSESTVILSLHGAHDRLVEFNKKVLNTVGLPDTQPQKNFWETWGDARSIVEMEFSDIKRTVQVEFFDMRAAAHLTADLHNQVSKGITFQVCSTYRSSFATSDISCFDSPTSYPSSPSHWSVREYDHEMDQPGFALAQMFSSQDQQQSTSCSSSSRPFSLFANSPPFRTAQPATPIAATTAPAKDQTRAAFTTARQKQSDQSNVFDIERVIDGADKRTTFMIRNIPNKYTQAMLKECIDATHQGKYDFLYLRIDFQNKCNVGYAFINFIDVKSVISFANDRVGRRWNRFNSEKRCSISYANIQGKEALIEKFRNSSVMEEEESYRPKIFYSSGPFVGKEQPFPNPTIPSDMRRQRQEHRAHREMA